MRQRRAETLVTEEPYAFIAHVRVCGGAGRVTAGSTRKGFMEQKRPDLMDTADIDPDSMVLRVMIPGLIGWMVHAIAVVPWLIWAQANFVVLLQRLRFRHREVSRVGCDQRQPYRT